MTRGRRHGAVLAVVAALALAVTACGSSSPAVATKAPSQRYYVSVGDSYAAGFQPTSKGHGHDTTNGFAYQVPGLAAPRGYDLKVVNFGCDGATTASVLDAQGCKTQPPDGPSYAKQTQAAAAEQFLRGHRGQVGLVTVSIGGNDVTRCAKAADAVTCVGAAVTGFKTRLGQLLTGLRSAAGPNVLIVGLTYPDVILGDYLSSSPTQKSLAAVSTTAFKALINPALQAQYEAVGATFVDVTAATGAYTPFSQTTDLPPYGTIPTAVADICRLTYFCQYQDIHPRTAGYAKIATLVADAMPANGGAPHVS